MYMNMKMRMLNSNNRFFNNTQNIAPPRIYLTRNTVSTIDVPPVNKPVIVDPDTRALDHAKMNWGEPTWFLFHTLAQKVKEENFEEIRGELIANIISICHNLPCPKCANHAVEYMKKINIHAILTKEDLKKMLFNFHNHVNHEKRYPIFDYTQLDEKYDKANTINIIHHFMNRYKVKDFNVNMINSNMQRDMIVKKLKVWFKNNIKYFDM